MRISRYLAQFIRDRGGNFGIMTAVAIPVIVGAAGISIDMTRAMQIKADMQAIADSASLAAATSLSNKKDYTEAQARDLANTFYATQLVQRIKTGSETDAEIAALMTDIKNATTVTIVSKKNGTNGKIYDVTITSGYTMPVNAMTAVVAGPSMALATKAAASSATESQNAFSMYLVLDRSGSMKESTDTQECIKSYKETCISYGYIKKIDALKSAVTGLLTVINKADPDNKYARLGAVSYNEKRQAPTPMAWGTTAVGNYAAALKADGSTNSGEATELAYDSLAPTMGDSSENEIHKKKNGQTPSKFIILMTDGENNVGNADGVTKAACDRARNGGSNKITVYTVAFMAPTSGRALLKYCASTPAHYFNAENSAELAAAFKSIGEAAAKGMTRLTQ
ncbi:vWA domain-containing protein [Rhizobium panacihumi]|uniref:vWA domain-containing protein n=1 Tax=Rhizobium panacihumi TaxID=2008450 RepID=UPI003D7BE88B